MCDDSGGKEETLSLIIKEEHGVLVVKRLLVCFAMGVSVSGSFTCRNLLSNYVDTELFSPILGPTWGGGHPYSARFPVSSGIMYLLSNLELASAELRGQNSPG